jgi:HSP20 family molecular chaperone IbpA
MTRKNPLDDALTELMDAWMDMMTLPQRLPLKTPPRSIVGDNIGDWEDRNGTIAITADMPGVEKKDIELNVDKHTVSVAAKTEERDYGFTKKFQPELNPDEVEAEFNNGVLDIKIQKAEEDKGKKIDIQ